MSLLGSSDVDVPGARWFVLRAAALVALLGGCVRPVAVPPADVPTVSASPEPAPDPAPAAEASAPAESDVLEACAAGNDDACLELYAQQPATTTTELAARVVVEMVGGDWDEPLSPEDRATFEEACRAGDGRACGFLGYQTSRGYGVPADPAAARPWYRLSCAQGYWFACNDLTMAGDRLGETISRRTFEAACDKGDAAGCYWAGIRFLAGAGGPSDEERGEALLVRACDGGYGTACYTLSHRDPDPAGAADLLRRGCEGGSPDACDELRSAKK